MTTWNFYTVKFARTMGRIGYDCKNIATRRDTWPIHMFRALAITLDLAEDFDDLRNFVVQEEFGPMGGYYWWAGKGLLCLPDGMDPTELFPLGDRE